MSTYAVIRVLAMVWFAALFARVRGWENAEQMADDLETAVRLLLSGENEGASFVPTTASVGGTPSMTSTVPTGPGGFDTTTLAGGAAVLVAVVVLAVYFVSRRGSKS